MFWISLFLSVDTASFHSGHRCTKTSVPVQQPLSLICGNSTFKMLIPQDVGGIILKTNRYLDKFLKYCIMLSATYSLLWAVNAHSKDKSAFQFSLWIRRGIKGNQRERVNHSVHLYIKIEVGQTALESACISTKLMQFYVCEPTFQVLNNTILWITCECDSSMAWSEVRTELTSLKSRLALKFSYRSVQFSRRWHLCTRETA